MERLGLGLYGLALRMLPPWVRRRAGAEMRELFARRQAELRGSRGRLSVLGLWVRELLGLVGTAYRSRRPPRWARATAPGASNDGKALTYRGPTMGTLRSDLLFAFRTTRRRPATALICVLTLALGVGASTAMFSVVESVLLRPLPYPEPDRLVSVYPGNPTLRGHPTLGQYADRGTWSWPEYFAVEEHQTSFETMAAYEPSNMTLRGDGPPERVQVTRTTWQLLPMLGAKPAVGRLFDANDRREDLPTVLSHAEWVARYGADPGVVGRTVSLNGYTYTILGVLPEGFEVDGSNAAYWLLMTASSAGNAWGNHTTTRAVARLSDGVTVQRAADELTSIFREVLPPGHPPHFGSVFPRQQDQTHVARPTILGMLAASFLLLLVACGNAAALLLGAGLDRERELALRAAVGASRGRIVTQLVTESALLGLVAAAAGVAVSFALTELLLHVAPTGVPGLEQARLDGAVLGFAVLIAVGCGVGCGLVPAVSLSSVHLAGAIGSNRTTVAGRARLQSAVVVGELALATCLAVSGLLLTRTVVALNRIDTGYDIGRLAVVRINPSAQRYQNGEGERDRGVMVEYWRDMVDEVAALPGVEAVAVTDGPPLTGYYANGPVVPEGRNASEEAPIAERRFVSAGFFQTMRMRILEGRPLRPGDYTEGAQAVAIVSEGLAAAEWPNASPLGRTFESDGRGFTVVGVSAEVNEVDIKEPTALAFYAPGVSGSLMIRTSSDPAKLLPAVRERIWSVDPDTPIQLSAPLTDLAAEQISTETYRARLMAAFALLGVMLALLGVYAVTARSVGRRTRELGVRLALGAKTVRLHGMVTTQAVRLAVYGAALGLALAAAGARLLQTFVWGVRVVDPLTFVAVAIAFPVFAGLAALGPARRATRVDLLEVLRAE